MSKKLILTLRVFIDRTAPLYLCKLIEQQNTSTNTRLSDEAVLLKHPPHSLLPLFKKFISL